MTLERNETIGCQIIEMSSEWRRISAVVVSLVVLTSVIAIGATALTVTPTAGTGILDGDDDEQRDTHLHAAADPGLNRGSVAHLTSHDTSTLDYALTVVDIVDVDLTNIDTLRFDYFEGEENANAAPDEVWLVIENESGRHIIFRTYNDGTISPATEWRTQSVLNDLGNSDRPWVEVDNAEDVSNPRQVLENLSEENLTEIGNDPKDFFGDTATLVAFGVGHGAPLSGPTVVDLYVDDLEVNDRTYDFPVSRLSFEPDPLNKSEEGVQCVVSSGSDCVNATIDIGGYWGTKTVHDINVSTIELNGTSVIDGSAVFLDTDGDDKDELRVQFKKDDIEDDLPDSGEDVHVTVDGVFDQDQISFAATDHIEVES